MPLANAELNATSHVVLDVQPNHRPNVKDCIPLQVSITLKSELSRHYLTSLGCIKAARASPISIWSPGSEVFDGKYPRLGSGSAQSVFIDPRDQDDIIIRPEVSQGRRRNQTGRSPECSGPDRFHPFSNDLGGYDYHQIVSESSLEKGG